MFNKILIANRGEIAVRIIRTCKDMGVSTVAIYSDSDRNSPHVLKADEAYYVGKSPSSESYLNISKIIDILRKSKADAVHPGYGFLSENCDFSRAVEEVGSKWIGPAIKVLETMGDKIAARELAIQVGAPILPGNMNQLKNITQARNIAKDIGYPILIKAAGGGGGKGMRIIQHEKDLKNSINQARSEAIKAFSDDRIYIEKYLEEPHHIEIQIIADNKGNIISLGERECSIQRRYQKIIEETPSPFIDNTLRQKLTKTAIDIATHCNYTGVGTVEFLVDKYYNYYFLEMNTRLQVEHPITEIVNDIDLVKEQIHIAAGEKLSFSQNKIQPKGHAIECRIYAEDGFNNFAPSIGKLTDLSIPNGIGVRLDEGVRIGQEITPYYDPLLGKLIVWGNNRKIALQRMIRALDEFQIAGIESNIPFCLMVFLHSTFQKGEYSTHTLDIIKEELSDNANIYNKEKALAARIGAVQSHYKLNPDTLSNLKNQKINNWVMSGRQEELR